MNLATRRRMDEDVSVTASEQARRGGGRLDRGIGLARAFLAEHWPASAPASPLVLPAELAADSTEDRMTLVSEIDGRPPLAAAIDFSAKPRANVRPPLLMFL